MKVKDAKFCSTHSEMHLILQSEYNFIVYCATSA